MWADCSGLFWTRHCMVTHLLHMRVRKDSYFKIKENVHNYQLLIMLKAVSFVGNDIFSLHYQQFVPRVLIQNSLCCISCLSRVHIVKFHMKIYATQILDSELDRIVKPEFRRLSVIVCTKQGDHFLSYIYYEMCQRFKAPLHHQRWCVNVVHNVHEQKSQITYRAGTVWGHGLWCSAASPQPRTAWSASSAPVHTHTHRHTQRLQHTAMQIRNTL